MLGIGHRRRQTVRGQHQVALVALVGPAQRHTVGMRDARDALGETLGQRFERGGTGHEFGHLVQALQALVLFLQQRGFLLHPGLEASVHRLQLLGHAVEAAGQGTEFIGRSTVDPRAQVSGLDAADRLLEQAHGLEHEQVTGVDQQRRTHQGPAHHRHLQQMHQRGQSRQAGLDADHEAVDVRRKARRILAQAGSHGRRRRLGKAGAKNRPFALDRCKALRHRIVLRHEQRSIAVALAQQLQAALEFGHLPRHRLGLARAHRQHQSISLHAHAPGFVDCRGAAFELPRHPQQGSDTSHCQQQKRRGDQRQLVAEGPMPVAVHGANLTARIGGQSFLARTRAAAAPRRALRLGHWPRAQVYRALG